MRTTLLKLAAISAGAVVGLGILVASFYWYSTWPKPWDSHSITATFKRISIYDEPKPKEHEHRYSLVILFDVKNNSREDYTLPIDAWSQKLMEEKSGSLVGGAGWGLSMSEGNLPSVVPAHFFDPKPILIPANTTVELLIDTQSNYASDAVEGKTKEQVVRDEFGDVDALVVLDNVTHIRIDLPLKKAWTMPKSSKPTA